MILAQQLTANIDIGQIIIACSIGVTGYLIKRELDRISKKIEEHDLGLINLGVQVAHLIGVLGIRKTDLAEIARKIQQLRDHE